MQNVFANDYDRKASVVYLNNYRGSENYFYPGPISKWTQSDNFQVPDHNILVAGFPLPAILLVRSNKEKISEEVTWFSR